MREQQDPRDERHGHKLDTDEEVQREEEIPRGGGERHCRQSIAELFGV